MLSWGDDATIVGIQFHNRLCMVPLLHFSSSVHYMKMSLCSHLKMLNKVETFMHGM